MKITIHRGAHQIGGCITEIESDNAKILIDLGANLPDSGAKELNEEDVTELTKDVDAIFYTHYHGDHVGLFHLVPETVPQYISKGAQEVMACKYNALKAHGDYNKKLATISRFRNYEANVPIDIKSKIRVTPYYVSHSAFEAYMFKIEVEGKTLLHTGDFRKHGYIGGKLPDVLQHFVGNVDFLIIEGTMLGRKGEKVIRENDIKQNTIALLKKHKYVFALCSSTDIDRLASFHQACKDENVKRNFVCDTYQKSVLDIFTRYTESSLFKFDHVFIMHKSSIASLDVKAKLSNEGFLMPVRTNQLDLIKEMLEQYDDEPAYLIYSLWQGYYKGTEKQVNPQVIELRELFPGRILDGVYDGFHTSGHADVETLEEACRILRPRLGIIPIHKEALTSYQSLEIAKEFPIIESSEQLDNVEASIR